jgi:hypothetical protein
VVVAIVFALGGITHLLLRQRALRQAQRAASFVSTSLSSKHETAPRIAWLDEGRAAVAWLESDGRVGARVLTPAAHAAGEIVHVGGAGDYPETIDLVADGRGGAWLVLGRETGLSVLQAATGSLDFEQRRVLLFHDRTIHDVRAAAADGALFIVYREHFQNGGTFVRLDEPMKLTPRTVADGDGARSPVVCAAGGHVAVAYVDEKMGVVVRRAGVDPGTMAAPIVVSREAEAPGRGAPACFVRDDVLTVAYGVLANAADPRAGAELSAIVVASSRDGGHTFDSRTEVREPGLVLASPAIADDRAGRAALVYYAGRDTRGAAGALRWARFAPGEPASPREVRSPIFLVFGPDDARALGDALGRCASVAADGRSIATAFVDNAEGASHVAFAVLAP